MWSIEKQGDLIRFSLPYCIYFKNKTRDLDTVNLSEAEKILKLDRRTRGIFLGDDSSTMQRLHQQLPLLLNTSITSHHVLQFVATRLDGPSPYHPEKPLIHLPFNKSHTTIMTEQRKAVIKNADMSEAMQQDAVDIASVALSKYNIEKVSYTGVVVML